MTVISDNREQIIRSLNEASGRAKIIIMTGGLGPTNDDITKQTLSEYFNSELVVNEKVLEHIKFLLSQRGVELNNKNINQAMVPDNCMILHNEVGTAPGMWFEKDSNIYISLPGVPYEMKNIFLNYVIPEIQRRYNLPVIKHLTILTHGLPESAMASRIEAWEKSLPSSVKFAYLPSPGILRLRISVYGDKQEEVSEQLQVECTRLKKLINDYIFGYDGDTLEQVIGNILRQKKMRVAVAESCTGGRIAELITSVPGASEYFMGSVTAYSNQSKCDILGVNASSIKKHGAVSKEVAEQMATGVRKLFKADISVATTGIAGPSEGTPKKPVGTTWIAVNTDNILSSNMYFFGDNRERNIQKASVEALFMLMKVLLNSK